jgi:hypothetical protein
LISTLLRTMPRRMVVAVVTLLPLELANALEQFSKERGISKSALVRMLLSEYLADYMNSGPQPPPSGPVGPGGSALKGAGLAGPEAGRDEARLLIKENAGGESG